MTTTRGSAETQDVARRERDGYFLVEDLLRPDECAEFVGRLREYASGERAPTDGIRLQREPALERAGNTRGDGSDIRKISGLFGDDLFRRLISRREIVDRVAQVVGSPVRLFRADALMKPATVGSEKGVHQDSPYWPIEPMSLWSCWIPFEDATVENGCLLVVPGSHRAGSRPHVRTEDDYVIPTESYDVDGLLAVPMRRGSGLFFHSLLVHGSAANTSGLPRPAITMSYMGPGHRHTGRGGPAPSYPRVVPTDS